MRILIAKLEEVDRFLDNDSLDDIDPGSMMIDSSTYNRSDFVIITHEDQFVFIKTRSPDIIKRQVLPMSRFTEFMIRIQSWYNDNANLGRAIYQDKLRVSHSVNDFFEFIEDGVFLGVASVDGKEVHLFSPSRRS